MVKGVRTRQAHVMTALRTTVTTCDAPSSFPGVTIVNHAFNLLWKDQRGADSSNLTSDGKQGLLSDLEDAYNPYLMPEINSMGN